MPLAPIPFRVRIGVTGHRSLPDRADLACRIRDLLQDAPRRWFDPPIDAGNSKTPVVFTVVSALAEGADRLVADEILKLSGSDLEAVLPLAHEEYQRAFSSNDSRAEFHALLEKAGKTTVLNAPAPQNLLEEVRENAYERAGRFVADHCDILLAVWDGLPARGRGGTAEIVAYAKKTGVPLLVVPPGASGGTRLEGGRTLSCGMFSRLEAFNGQRVDERHFRDYLRGLRDSLLGSPEGKQLEDSRQTVIGQVLMPGYVRASMIAKKFQRLYLRTGLAVYLLSPMAVAAVAIGILRPELAAAAFAFEFGILIAILAALVSANRKRSHKRWLETRFLVERLRAAMFLCACGVPPQIPPRNALAKKDEEAGGWALPAFSEIMRTANACQTPEGDAWAAGREFVRRHWLQEQILFHARRAARSRRIGRILERLGWAVFLAAIFASGLHLSSILLGHPGLLAELEHPVVFLALVLPAVGAAIGGIRAHREYSRLDQKSRAIVAALKDLDARLAQASSRQETLALLREIERLTFQENQDWIGLMSFARLEPV